MGEKRTYRVYSDADRAQGLATLAQTGGRSDLAAKALGIPRQTLERWGESQRVATVTALTSATPDYEQERRKSDAKLEQGLLNVVFRGLKRLSDRDAWEKAGVKDAAIATGIAHTHLRLLRSQATSITEQRGDLASFLVGAAYGVRAARGAPPAGVSAKTDPDGGGGE